MNAVFQNIETSQRNMNQKKKSRLETIIDQQNDLINEQISTNKNKKNNNYSENNVKSDNFESIPTPSQNNTDSNDESSRNCTMKLKFFSSGNNTEKTIVTNKSAKERIIWSKAKFVEMRKKIKIAKFRVIQKEARDFNQIYLKIDNDLNDEFL